MEIPYKNLFMVCERLEKSAYRELPEGFHFRLCRPDELEVWKDIQLDRSGGAPRSMLDDYYAKWYAEKGDLFFQKCTFVCDERDTPIAACFLWKQYDRYNTVHWFKVLKPYEGRGIGRALMTRLFRECEAEADQSSFPIYLHSQPSSFRAIKLYTDFGFSMVTAPSVIDGRPNEWKDSVELLRELMPEEAFARLKFTALEE